MAIQLTRDKKDQFNDQQIAELYNQLLALDRARAPRQQKVATRFSDSEFQTATAYAIRVAKNHTLDEFKEFVRTGKPVNPVKMTAAEMQLLVGGEGGEDEGDWVGEVARAVTSRP